MKQPLSIAQAMAVLLLLFALWIGGWTLTITTPTFEALQKEGIQKTARVNQKLPYGSVCTGRSCKRYVLKVRFFTGGDEGLGASKVPGSKPGQLIFAELEVNQAVYERIRDDDPIRVVFLEHSPQELWSAETILRWKPWTNYLVSGLLLLGGVSLLRWNRRLGNSRAKREPPRGNP